MSPAVAATVLANAATAARISALEYIVFRMAIEWTSNEYRG